MELHRGRLIDHLQLVVKDLPASRRFYEAALQALGIPIGGAGDGFFWIDELFISTAESQAAQGHFTGYHHIAFQAEDRAAVDAFHEAAWQTAAGITARRASAPTTIRDITPRSCSTPTATTSRPSITAKQRAARLR